MKKSLLLTALFILAPAAAFAECPLLREVLSTRAEDLSAFSARNAQMMASVLEAENNCKVQGAKISARIAKAAESLSCMAQADAAEINMEMEKIGVTCTNAFQKRHELQTMLHTEFNKLLADVDDGVDFIVKSDILQESCGEEVHVAKKLYTASHVTEGNIVATEVRALAAMNSYEKFRETSEQLKQQTQARTTNCGQQLQLPALPPLPSGVAGPGGPLVAVGGTTPKSVSDITGTIDDPKLASLATRTIERPDFRAGAGSERLPAGVSPSPAGRGNAAYPVKKEDLAASALAHYAQTASLQKRATASSSPAPATALDSAVLAAFQASEPAESPSPAEPKVEEAAEGAGAAPAPLAQPSRAPASVASFSTEEPNTIRFLGEVSSKGERLEESSSSEDSLFRRVATVYRRQEKKLRGAQAPALMAEARGH